MDENIISLIAKELNIAISQVKNTLELLEEGATVPFIARYRKERTKGLDEEQIRVIHRASAMSGWTTSVMSSRRRSRPSPKRRKPFSPA